MIMPGGMIAPPTSCALKVRLVYDAAKTIAATSASTLTSVTTANCVRVTAMAGLIAPWSMAGSIPLCCIAGLIPPWPMARVLPARRGVGRPVLRRGSVVGVHGGPSFPAKLWLRRLGDRGGRARPRAQAQPLSQLPRFGGQAVAALA